MERTPREVGWTAIDHVRVPYVIRDRRKFVVVRLLESTLLADYQHVDDAELRRRAPLISFFMTSEEARAMNDVTDGDFSGHDLIVQLADFVQFYAEVKTRYGRTSAGLKCGWLQINSTVTPYVVRDGRREVPLSIVRHAAKLLQGLSVVTRAVTSDERLHLNAMCNKANISFQFSESTRLVSIDAVVAAGETKVTVLDLPDEDPMAHAYYEYVPEAEDQNTQGEAPSLRHPSNGINLCPPLNAHYPAIGKMLSKKASRTSVIRPKTESSILMAEDALRDSRRQNSILRGDASTNMIPHFSSDSNLNSASIEQQQPRSHLHCSDMSNSESQAYQQLLRGVARNPVAARDVRFQGRVQHHSMLDQRQQQPSSMFSDSRLERIVPVVILSKTVACLVNDFGRWVLVEAIAQVYFPHVPIPDVQHALRTLVGAELPRVTPKQESMFIRYYGLEMTSLAFNTVVDERDLASCVPQVQCILPKEQDQTHVHQKQMDTAQQQQPLRHRWQRHRALLQNQQKQELQKQQQQQQQEQHQLNSSNSLFSSACATVAVRLQSPASESDSGISIASNRSNSVDSGDASGEVLDLTSRSNTKRPPAQDNVRESCQKRLRVG